MIGTNFLRSTGLLDAYEHVVSSMVEEGWPPEKSIFDHAAYLLLKWQGDNQDAITMQGAAFRKNFLMNTGAPVPQSASMKDYKKSISDSGKKPKSYD